MKRNALRNEYLGQEYSTPSTMCDVKTTCAERVNDIQAMYIL